MPPNLLGRTLATRLPPEDQEAFDKLKQSYQTDAQLLRELVHDALRYLRRG